jgi:glycosyltransferase involved in cell wall biosynthesis
VWVATEVIALDEQIDMFSCEHGPKGLCLKAGSTVSVSLAFVSMTENFGGHEVMLARWLQEVARQRAIKPVLVSARNPKLKVLVDGVPIRCEFIAPRPRLAQRVPRVLGKALTFAFLLRAFLAVRLRTGARDAVVSEGALMSEPMATLAARVAFRRIHLYVPMVESFQSLGYPDAEGADQRFKRVYRWVPTSWITLSHEHASIFREWSKVRQPVHVLRNTTAEAIECASPLCKGFPAAGEELRVLVLGRLSAHHKGLDLLLAHLCDQTAALSALKIRFVLVGDGEYRSEIEQAMSTKPELSRVLELHAWASPLDAYRMADCVLLASRIEGVPLVMLEAMSLGLPVVASDLPGTRAYLGPESLYPVGDLERAVQLISLLRHPDSRGQLIARQRTKYAALASAKAFADNVQQLTRDLTD